jgi:signal peptidase II
MTMRTGSMLRWLWITLLVILVDQGTKQLVLSQLQLHESVYVLPIFNLTHMINPGAAFSFLSQQDGWQRWFFILLALIVSGVLLVWLYRLERHESWTAIALVLILGGALGNVIDRIFRGGGVIDFLHFHYQEYFFPAFNIADSAITIGVAVMLLDALVLSARRGR